jgi:DNA-binding beta-propeller fold protein YncE
LLSLFLDKNKLSFKDPKGIDFHGDYLYIIDIKYIRQIDKTSKQVIGKWSLPKGTIKFCGKGGCGLKVDNEQFYFTLWDSHQIYVYNPSLRSLKSYGKSFTTWRGGEHILEFDHPRGLTVAGEKLYVCDYGNHRIQVLNKFNGEFIRTWGKEGKKNGELYFPEGIFLYDELLYIGDNEGVQVFGKEGAFIQRIGTSGRNRSGSSVGAGANRRLWGGGAADGQINHAKGICIVGNKLYVADNGNHRIQVFT